MIFRNPAKDLLELEVRTVDDFCRVMLKFPTDDEMDAME